MDVKDRDIERLLDIAGDDAGRPLPFAIDDVVRQGRRRTRIRRTGTMAAAAITTAAVATGAVVWANSDRATPSGGDEVPVATRSAVKEQRLLPDHQWVKLDHFWFRSYNRVSHTPGVLSGLIIEFADQPVKGDDDLGDATWHQGAVLEKQVIDRGWYYSSPVGHQKAYPVGLVRGDARSGVFTVTTERGRVELEATVYRLGSKPGWAMLVGGRMPAGRFTSQTFDAYDAAGKVLLHCSMASAAPPVCDR